MHNHRLSVCYVVDTRIKVGCVLVLEHKLDSYMCEVVVYCH